MKQVIKQILKNKKITDYLDNKGIKPFGQPSGGRVKYCCPLHGEKIPSFTVYLNDSYENFYCFGCKKGSNIINLYKELEKVSYKVAIEKLSQDLDINLDSEIDDAIEELENSYKQESYSTFDLALLLSQEIFKFNKQTNFKWFEATEKIFKISDNLLQRNDLNNMKKLVENTREILLKKKEE